MGERGQSHVPPTLSQDEIRCPLNRMLSEAQDRSGRALKISTTPTPPQGFDPPTVQPVVSTNNYSLVVRWFRRLLSNPSPWRPRFTYRAVHVGFVVDNVAMGQVFPCQYHSTNAAYSCTYGRRKVILVIHSTVKQHTF
jgi:hypothetical protein